MKFHAAGEFWFLYPKPWIRWNAIFSFLTLGPLAVDIQQFCVRRLEIISEASASFWPLGNRFSRYAEFRLVCFVVLLICCVRDRSEK